MRRTEYPLLIKVEFECSECKSPLELADDRTAFRDDESTTFVVVPCEKCLKEARDEGAADAS